MLTRQLLSLGFLGAAVVSMVACSSPLDEAAAGATDEALTADSIGLVCRTLGEIGQCGSSKLCRPASAGKCKAKAWNQGPAWEQMCNGNTTESNCHYALTWCEWEVSTTCTPSNGTTAKPVTPDIAATCSALGELGACDGVAACKSSVQGVCRASDEASVLDPQWVQMCPRAGTSQEACDAQGANCFWDDVQTCSPRATGKLPLDVGTACKTLGQTGACSSVPSVCKSKTTGLCAAKPDWAGNPNWERMCNGNATYDTCRYSSNYCDWKMVDDCVPQTGSRADSIIDTTKACDTFGQLGTCSRAPMCKVIAAAACRATAAGLATDPDLATQCARASGGKDACDFLGSSCAWVPTTACIPK